MGNGSFRLCKWYLDCVTDSGDAFVAYSAHLQWGPIALHYAGVVDGRAVFVSQTEPVQHNGVRCDEEPVLDVESTRVLRDGALGDTILSAFPKVRKLFPEKILSVRETKWLSRASLGDDAGWALYERVRWS